MNSKKLRLIGSGNQSQLWGYGEGKQQVVLKVVSSKFRKEQLHLKNEFELLQAVHHRNVVKSLRYRQKVAFEGNKTDKQPTTDTHNILVLEHANRGSLLNHLQTNPDIHARRIAFRQVAHGLAYLHSEGIAHRDLKLQNILVFAQETEDIYKISDFGFASRFLAPTQNIKFSEYKGTKKGYMAPEIHKCHGNPSNYYDAPKADIFALGVILFALVFGHLPFEYAQEQNSLYKLIVQKNYQAFWNHHKVTKFQDEPGFRMEEMKDLFQRMVAYNPQQRPSMAQVLKHGWLSK